jgi:hypothetical protein
VDQVPTPVVSATVMALLSRFDPAPPALPAMSPSVVATSRGVN